MKKSFEVLDLEGLEDSAFVNLEMKDAGGHRSTYSGVDVTQNILTRNEAKKILMWGFSPLALIRQKNPKIDLLLSNENVKFLEAPFTPKDAIKALHSEGEKISGERLQDLNEKEINNKVGVLLHQIHAQRSSDGKITINTGGYMPEMVKEAKEYFPALVTKTDEEIVEFLFNIRENVPEVMKGQNIEGVFCDIEGTLFNGEELNKATLEKLKELEAQGKNIILWTDGDISSLQKLLDKEGIKYPLKSKIDYAGASAEIVIDNDDQNTFSAKTKIFAKKFIKI